MKATTTSGKRKRSVAHAHIRAGKGNIKINKVRIEKVLPSLARLKMQEPLIIAGETAKKYDIDVTTHGGGIMSSADAARQAIARGLVFMEKKLKQTFLEYDRHLLVSDIRRKETRKPNDSKARAMRQKSYR